MKNTLKLMKQLTNKQYFYMVLFFVFVMMLILNYFTPLLADDFTYSFGLDGQRVNDMLDIVEYQVDHYMTWGGRTIVHGIAQLFLMMSKHVFNILNSLVYVLFVLLIYWHSIGNCKEFKPILYLLIHFAIWFLLPVFGQNILWLIGSCNYLWGSTILLLFLLPFRLYINNENHSNSILLMIGMCIFGILAGWTNENSAAALLTIIVLFGTYRLFLHKKISYWHISGFVGALIGFLVMILAPGNAIRSKIFDNGFSLLRNIISRILTYTNNLLEYLLPALIVFVIISVIAYYHGWHKKEKVILSLIYLFGMFISVYSMVLSPTFPERSWMAPVIFLVIAIGHAYSCLDMNFSFIKTSKTAVTFLLLLAFLFSYNYALKETIQFSLSWKSRIQYINEQLSNDNKDIEVPKIVTDNRHVASYQLEDLYQNPNYWPNTSVAKYFGLNSIKSEQ